MHRRQIDGRRDRLIRVRVHPPAEIHHTFSRSYRGVPRDELRSGVDGRVTKLLGQRRIADVHERDETKAIHVASWQT